MPIYVYFCKECQKEFESLVMSYKEVTECPECKSRSCERVITAHQGYTIGGNNSASQRPKSAGSFKRGK